MEGMENATLALVPSLLWLGLFIRVRGEGLWQEPHWLLALSFATGMMVTAPAMAVEKFVLGAWDEQGQTALSLVTGPVEELAKYIAVSAGVMDLRRLAPGLLETGQIKPERNGALHAAAAAMGFAAVENFLYLNTFGAQAILLRGPVSTLHHLSMALIWGLALAGQGGPDQDGGKGDGHSGAGPLGSDPHRVEPLHRSMERVSRGAGAPVAGLDGMGCPEDRRQQTDRAGRPDRMKKPGHRRALHNK